MGSESVIEAWLSRFKRRREAGVLDAQEAQPDRAAAIGALGEALVAGAVRDIGWPALRNVVLRERGRSTEIDVIVRAPSALIVLEVKTWSGFIEGSAWAAEWRRWGAGGEVVAVPNAVVQNRAHVSAVQSAIGNRRIAVCGLVVSAGHARFAPALRPHVVPSSEVTAVLRRIEGAPELEPRRVDKAWAYLSREAECSPQRLAAHVAQAKANARAR